MQGKWCLAITKLPLRQGGWGKLSFAIWVLNRMKERSEVKKPQKCLVMPGLCQFIAMRCQSGHRISAQVFPDVGEWVCDICPACFLGVFCIPKEIGHEASQRGEEVLLVLRLQLGSEDERGTERMSQPMSSKTKVFLLSLWKVTVPSLPMMSSSPERVRTLHWLRSLSEVPFLKGNFFLKSIMY